MAEASEPRENDPDRFVGTGLDTIEETDEEFRIGCMCTLRMLETHEGLNTYFREFLRSARGRLWAFSFEWGDGRRQCVRKIWFFRYHDLPDGARYLCELYQGGVVSLKEFNHMKYDRVYSGAHY